MNEPEDPVGTTPQQDKLAAYVLEAARRAGYDMDSPRGGGKTKLANDSGMSLTTLSRLLSGDRMPDPKYFEALAKALQVPVLELLVEANIISADAIADRAVPPKPMTDDEIIAKLGVTDPDDKAMVLAMVERLRDRPPAPKRDHGLRGVGGHPRAHTLKADEQPGE